MIEIYESVQWCNFLVPALTQRASDSSLPGQSLAGVVRARSSAIENLNPTWQLQAISKVIYKYVLSSLNLSFKVDHG